MAKIDVEYHKLLQKIKQEGFKYEDPNRKDVYRLQIPSYQIIHNFSDGFPAITTKKLYWKGVVGELLWFLRGDTNIKYLVDNGINIWNKDAYNYYLLKMKENNVDHLIVDVDSFIEKVKVNGHNGHNYNLGLGLGKLGRVYGAQWRNWTKNNDSIGGYRQSIDQISNLIKELKENPMGTRHIVTAWNPAELDDMALPPCHWSFEILVEPLSLKERFKNHKGFGIPKGFTDFEIDTGLQIENAPSYQFTLKWHQRSVDTFLGLPFNIASYALLAQIIGKMTNMIPKGIIGDLSNVHIYEPHMNAVNEQLSRDVNKYDGLKTKVVDFHDIKEHYEDKGLDDLLNELDISENFILKNYKSYPRIPAEMLAYNN